jgi:hypothetical protein
LVQISYDVAQNCTIFGQFIIDFARDHDAPWAWVEKFNDCSTKLCGLARPCELCCFGWKRREVELVDHRHRLGRVGDAEHS